jgi:DNA-binding transcriptional LysR family regulator
MDFDQLTTFLEVARLGNFSRAGEKVFRSQSAVSVQIRQLEQDYGTRLLDRTGKRVQLTPAGEVLFEYAMKLIALRNESLSVVAGPEETPRGTLSIGANEATCLYVLPDIFTAYRSLNPHVQISIYRSFSHKVVQKLHDGAVDVGVVSMPVKDHRLVAQQIFHDPLMLIVSSDHPLARKTSVTIGEVVQYPILLPKIGQTRMAMDRLFRPYQAHLQVAMELPSVAMIKAFVASGVGISLICGSFASHECRAGALKLIPLSDVDLARELALVYRRERALPRAAMAFIELVLETINSSSPSCQTSARAV